METSSNTKQCPFCEEALPAAAVVCRSCGRELQAPEPRGALGAPATQHPDDAKYATLRSRPTRRTLRWRG